LIILFFNSIIKSCSQNQTLWPEPDPVARTRPCGFISFLAPSFPFHYIAFLFFPHLYILCVPPYFVLRGMEMVLEVMLLQQHFFSSLSPLPFFLLHLFLFTFLLHFSNANKLANCYTSYEIPDAKLEIPRQLQEGRYQCDSLWTLKKYVCLTVFQVNGSQK
jgi:hypothetical protein